jgi:hypothetical protein
MGNRSIELGLYRVPGKLIHLSIKLISVSDSAGQRQRDRFEKDASKLQCAHGDDAQLKQYCKLIDIHAN